MNVFLWLGQLSTILGTSSVGGAVTGLITGAMTWQTALPLVVFGVISAVMPENKTTASAAQTVAADLVNLVSTLTAKPAAPAPVPTTAPATTS